MYLKYPGGKFACVKGTHIVSASPHKVFELLIDNGRVHEYNSLAEPGTMRDIESISDDTKIKWVRAMPIFPFKTRDFCTLTHWRKLKDGTIAIISSATTHNNAPITNKYCRASIVIGANIIRPIVGHSNKCELTMLTQLDPGGILPPVLVNQVCSSGPIGFFDGIESSLGQQ